MTILGFTEEITTCDCCGRTELKGTYAMQTESGEQLYYGSTCGVNAARLSSDKELKNEVKKVEIASKWSTVKGDMAKVKIMNEVVKKGLYAVNEFFIKFGTVEYSNDRESCYSVGHKTVIIAN